MGLLTRLINAFKNEGKDVAGLEAIVQFTTPDEPKLSEYPKGAYKAFWEIILQQLPGGWQAIVRFHGYANTDVQDSEHFLVASSLGKLKPQVNALIRSTMANYKR